MPPWPTLSPKPDAQSSGILGSAQLQWPRKAARLSACSHESYSLLKAYGSKVRGLRGFFGLRFMISGLRFRASSCGCKVEGSCSRTTLLIHGTSTRYNPEAQTKHPHKILKTKQKMYVYIYIYISRVWRNSGLWFGVLRF